MYIETAEKLRDHFKPEFHAQLTESARTWIAQFIVLAANWSAGDALAGLILEKRDLKQFASGLKALGFTTRDTYRLSSSWAVVNLDSIADFFLEPEYAAKVKTAAVSGSGLLIYSTPPSVSA